MSEYNVNSTTGLISVPIVPFGIQAQKVGWTVGEHPSFGGVSNVHTDTSHHYNDNAIDLTWHSSDFSPDGKMGWADWTADTGKLMQGAGSEVLHRDNFAGHETHLHLAGHDGMITLNPEQAARFGFNFGEYTPSATDQPADSLRATAKERTLNYADMSKAELDTEYDKLRGAADDILTAEEEGMKMHRAYFGK